MADIVVFVPKAERDAEKNLKDFVALCRDQLTVFGADLPFEANHWSIGKSVKVKGRGALNPGLIFCTMATAKGKNHGTPMAEPFLSFAKAYMRYQQGMAPTKNTAVRLSALRAVEAALTEGSLVPNPVRIDGALLNRAAQLAKEAYSQGYARNVGVQLERLAEFVSANGLVRAPLQWRNPIKEVSRAGARVGPEFDARRQEKLPSKAALEALPQIFRLVTNPADVIVSSVVAILCSAPSRVNEPLLLPADCEVFERTKEGNEAYGLRWWPAKGANPMVKWVVPSMAGVVKDAVAKLRRETEAARVVARWYEAQPNQMYLPPELLHVRDQEWLALGDLVGLLYDGESSRQAAQTWCKGNEVLVTKRAGRLYVRFADVERAVLASLPAGFPVMDEATGLHYSQALLVVRRSAMHRGRNAVYRSIIEPVTSDQVNASLAGHSGKETIFEAFGFTEEDGSRIFVTSHMFRHYLNTLAQIGGLSQLDIAKWSGRVDIKQNEAYDHVSAGQMVLKVREALGDGQKMFGPLAETPKHLIITRDEFARLKVPTAHTTDFGFCIHDYTMSPCQQHMDCINCREHACVKGDKLKTEMLQQRHAEAVRLLELADAAKAEGYVGSDRWYRRHAETVEKLEQLVAIMDDPAIPAGAVIQLSGLEGPSRIAQALEERKALSLPELAAIRNLMPRLGP